MTPANTRGNKKKTTVKIDQDLCARCLNCTQIVEEVFFYDEKEDEVKVDNSAITDENIDLVREAAECCPSQAIIINED
ncbi:MAG: ferredoxin [Patescibacteria group bacterium]